MTPCAVTSLLCSRRRSKFLLLAVLASLTVYSRSLFAGLPGRRLGTQQQKQAEVAPGGRRQLGGAEAGSAPAALHPEHADEAGTSPGRDEELAAEAVPLGAGVHGFVHKAGPLDPRHWHASHSRWRQDQRQRWLAQRERLATGSPPPPLPLLSSCQVWVNHLYRVVYLRHAKTASSSLLCHFSGCRAANASDAAQRALSFEPLQMLAGDELAALWRDYFVVTFVRSPYQRAVSSYRMMARQLDPEAAGPPGSGGDSSGGGGGGYGWDHYCVDPAGFADVCEADARCSKKGREFVYAHLVPQAPCVAAAGGGWAADFVGRVESIDADLALVLAELERRRPADAPPVKPLGRSLENVNGRGCNETGQDAGGRLEHTVAQEQYCDPVRYYSGKHAACFEAVRRHYGEDVRALRFAPRAVSHAARRADSTAAVDLATAVALRRRG